MIFSKKGITEFWVLAIITLSCCSVQARTHSYKTGTDTTRTVNVEIVKDNPIISMLDSLALLTFKGIPDFRGDRSALNKYNFSADFIPSYNDSIYRARIKKLDQNSPFGYVYNPMVKQYIDLYAIRKRGLTERILGLAGVYFPLFEEQLDRFNMPLELKYLAVIESALNPIAKSPVGAKGLWQFMYNTGKIYDLKVSSYVDDRNDPYKATIAACKHMKDLYNIYGNWSLVLAAYNSGAGNVNRAIRKAGGVMDYWAIQRFLPRETRDYVPAFIAVSYVMQYSAEHNLYPVYPGILASDIDTVTVKQVLSFDQISEMFNIPVENLRFLNPAYTKDIIPANSEKSYFLRLPSAYIADFINNEEALYAYRTQKGLERERLLAQVREIQDRTITHVVRQGETLASIAKKYHCSISDLKKWNGLRKGHVKRNQELMVYVTESVKNRLQQENKGKDSAVVANNSRTENKSNATSRVKADSSLVGPPTIADYLGHDAEKILNSGSNYKTAKLNLSKQNDKVIYHTIRQGDTLWGIANQYKGVTVEQIKQLNQIKNARDIKPGQKIKISIDET
ncbi:MAG: LysM peptidoglycan-binding domain-containing protein [Bacteroidales bacterium]